MPRHSRIDIPNTVFHIYTRGHNKAPLFFDDEDRYVLLKHLKRAQDRHPWQNLGYSLMTNHYHMQVKTKDTPIGKTMHYLNSLYAGYFNHRYQRFGHVFQNRFHSIPVQTDSYLLTLSRYIHLNSTTAGITQRPEDYRWSSYLDYLGRVNSGLVQPGEVLELFGDDPATQRQHYRQFVEEKLHRKPDFDDSLIWKTRIFGDDHFTNWVAAQCPQAFPRREKTEEKSNI